MLHKQNNYNCSLTNNLNKPFYYALLVLGLLTLPLLGFSQQEQPKRVTVVVTAKEITPQKLVQLPADNVPSIVSGKPKATLKKKLHTHITAKPKTKPATQTTSAKALVEPSPKAISAPTPKSKSVAKENTIAKAVPKNQNTAKPVAVAPPAQKEETVVEAQPGQQKENKKIDKEVAPPAPITTANTLGTSAEIEKTTKPEDNATIQTNSSRDTPQLSPDGQTNATSYIWIGVFLIIAGVVLGLLFGKPAFLISFVGVVFIALGIII